MVWHRCVMYSTRLNGGALKAGRKRRVDTKPSKGWQGRECCSKSRSVARPPPNEGRQRTKQEISPGDPHGALNASVPCVCVCVYGGRARRIAAGGRAGPKRHVPADWETKSPFGMTTLSSEFLAQSTMPLRPFMGKLMSVITDTAGSLWMLATARGQHTGPKNTDEGLHL